jgi:hypothetical protein
MPATTARNRRLDPQHRAACARLADPRPLNEAERHRILDTRRPARAGDHELARAYCTPRPIAQQLATHVRAVVLDLCAGIGRLADACRRSRIGEPPREIVCLGQPGTSRWCHKPGGRLPLPQHRDH